MLPEDLERKYAEAANIAKERKPPISLSTDQKIAMYCHYKQVEVGPVDIPRPGFFDLVGRAKWDAWNALGNMSREEAMKKYIEIVNDIYSAF